MSGQGQKGRPIGGIGDQKGRYSTLGGRSSTQHSSVPEGQKSEISAVQTSSSQEVETADLSTVQNSRLLKVQTAKPKRAQLTVYVPPGLAKWIRRQAVDEEREISEIATEAFEMYRDAKG